MKVSSFEAIVAARNGAGVRYLVAGGLAVNAHGYVRLTHDVDHVVQLDPANILPAFAALGYRPLVPVTAAQFADPAQRATWIRDKGMTVLNFHSDRHPTATVDIFVSDPFDFDAEYARALQAELSPGTVVRFVGDTPQADWSNATWEGSRRAQLRAALALSVRERLLAMQELGELSEKLATMPRMAAPPNDNG